MSFSIEQMLIKNKKTLRFCREGCGNIVDSSINLKNRIYLCRDHRNKQNNILTYNRRKGNRGVKSVIKFRLMDSRKSAKINGYMPCTATAEELFGGFTTVCKICNTDVIEYKKIYLDHCHFTGKFRAWLCNKCNTNVGMVDNKKYLEKIIQYVKEHS